MIDTVIDNMSVADKWLNAYLLANEDIFNFKIVKPDVVEWVEANIKLPRTSSDYSGAYSYNLTPYWREPVGHFHPESPVRTVSIMKCVQSGCTEGVILPAIIYSISEDPCNMLLTAADLTQAKDTIEKRFDPVMLESGLNHLIRAHVIKKTNNRSGDTGGSKEYVGGSLYAKGTQSPAAFRQYPSKKNFADDYDNAPRNVGKEGSIKGLLEGRQNSYGDRAKSCFVSTPTITQTSNINDVFLLGTQKEWHWPCPHCGEYMILKFRIEVDDKNTAGIVYKLDGKGRLITDSVAYMCPHCAQLTTENSKYELNLNGIWVPGTKEPVERNHESYHFNGLALPPGFTGWVKIVEEWILANPQGQKADREALKTWNNLRMGLPFADMGDSPRVNELMQNTRTYLPGVVPDLLCKADGNASIVMLTLSVDINGVMQQDLEDVRVDWEVLAHSATGATYSVDHGSIGTYKRTRDRSKEEVKNDIDRDKWTLTPNVKFSVWPEIEKLIYKEWDLESYLSSPKRDTESEPVSGKTVDISIIDTGFGEKLAMQFIQKIQDANIMCYGIKGKTDENGRKLDRDTNPIKRSIEKPRLLYIAQVDQLKDELSQYMKLRAGEDGSQPSGFMNYPEPRDGKYTMKSYFKHYEGERRTIVEKNGEPVGFFWKKKNNQVENHFWDVRIYNLAAPLIFIDVLKQYPKYKNLTWEAFVQLIEG